MGYTLTRSKAILGQGNSPSLSSDFSEKGSLLKETFPFKYSRENGGVLIARGMYTKIATRSFSYSFAFAVHQLTSTHEGDTYSRPPLPRRAVE